VRSEVQILPGPPLTQRCAPSFRVAPRQTQHFAPRALTRWREQRPSVKAAAPGAARARLRRWGKHRGAAFSEPGGSRRECEHRCGRSAQPGLRRGCSSVGRAPALQAGGHRFDSVHLHHRVTSTTERMTPKRHSRGRARQRRHARPKSAGGEARRRARAHLCADRGEADLAIGHDARWRLIFDRVNREYLSSMIGCGGAVTSVTRRQWSVVCSGEKSVFMRDALLAVDEG
jgi:hypothetical protein